MGHLEDVPVERLREALDRVEGKRPTERLMVAIAYKQGVSQSDLAEWYGIERKTVYNWLTRFEDAPPEEAVRDDDRPGRPGKLTAEQRTRLERALDGPPARAGYDAESWTPALVGRYVEETFGVDYSESSLRRILREHGANQPTQ